MSHAIHIDNTTLPLQFSSAGDAHIYRNTHTTAIDDIEHTARRMTRNAAYAEVWLCENESVVVVFDHEDDVIARFTLWDAGNGPRLGKRL